MSVSPYKKLKTVNSSWVSYINIKFLKPNILYKMTGLNPTDHKDFGKGQQAYLLSGTGEKYRAQLPGKYLMSLTDKDITTFKRDIANLKHPYLVFRKIMPDNSYHIDIVEKSDDVDRRFNEGLEMPELETSIEEITQEEDQISQEMPGTGEPEVNESEKDSTVAKRDESDKNHSVEKKVDLETKEPVGKNVGSDSD